MLHIIQSNRMEALQLHLSQSLMHSPNPSIFNKEQVLVQSPGMAQWLKVLIAEQHGVTGQIDYVLPSSYIWRLYQSLLSDVPQESSFNKNNMAWKLFNILPNCLEQAEFALLKQYLVDTQTALDNDTRLFSLCEKIADAFDQYLMYRPVWLESWQQGDDELADVDISIAPWQPILWRKLVEHTKTLGQNPYHRANLHQDLIASLNQNAINLSHQNLYIFGLSAIPSQQLEVFQALAKHIDVYIYLCNPSKHYWGDVVDEKTKAKIIANYDVKPNIDAEGEDYYIVGNPLLASWGKLGREYLEQLVELDAQWTDIFIEAFDENLLGQLQQEIFELAFKGMPLASDPTWFVSDEGKLTYSENKGYSSFQFARCHNALREVEALHDHLLNLFSADDSLSPRDIIVMMPDSGQYSPYIEAVFGSAKDNRYIPFAISDLGVEQEKPIVNSFIKLADLGACRFYVSDILDLLQVDEISTKFEISSEELNQIGYWLEQVNIRWGIDGEHKGEFNQPKIAINSWRQGLSRLILGFASKDENTEFNQLFAADQVEGMAVETLAKLIRFFDALEQTQKELKASGNLADKVKQLQQLTMRFYASDISQNNDLGFVQKALEHVLQHFENNDHTGAVSQVLMVHILKQQLMQKGVGQRFFMGQVNFCTLMPMRAVPFKVVCILGLNDGDYPRTVQPLGFDLLQHSKPQKGDRSRKMDDRYLFLEAILSAREHLYLSYIGNSCVDNSERLPSVLVSELTDYLSRVFEHGKDRLIESLTVRHYLQPFNPAYYQQSHLQSYNPIWLPKQTPATGQNEPLVADIDTQVDLALFIQQLLAPQQSFYRSTIGARLGDYQFNNQDDETFALDGLTRYRYLQEIIERDYLSNAPNLAAIIARGDLPQGAGAELAFDNMVNTVEPLLMELKRHQIITGDETPIESTRVDLSLSMLRISGALKPVSLATQYLYRPTAKLKAKDKIAGYLYHLAGSASGDVNSTVFLSLDGYIEYQQLNQDEALSQLEKWGELYLCMFTRPLPLFATTGFSYLQKRDFAAAENTFSGASFVGQNELSDPYIALDFTSLESVAEEFIELTETYLAPIDAIITEHKYAKS
ncbi:exodeoxyribonuclease V subunit gamma [Pseudoalteromonas spongiae]|uniref:exodeoxyribonuclease V subunit gamma n=1 Tax=Pseudoalteromonas spongiae TaxID=298657 RepID=UPI00026CAEF6|nr:exodeoxyribonuclease V subunit gamma [Pseudoalteromonas spongiae]ATC98502.1 exodeoxyribonuclease V gamma subunit [Pseudoalteromonas spongiae UST010723-006]